MEKNAGLLPFAYSSHTANERVALDTAPREKHVIDENARSMYHTRTSQSGEIPKKNAARPKGPTLLVVPPIKRKLGESFYENDDKKRQDINEIAVETETNSSSAATNSASFSAIDSDQSTDVTEPDGSEEFPVPLIRPETHNLPSSPPQIAHGSDVSINDYAVPSSPVYRRRQISLNTSPVIPGPRVLNPSSEPDFGIDPFNRFRVSFRDQFPSTDTDTDAEAPTTSSAHNSLFSAAKDVILGSFEDVRSTVSLQGMHISEIPDEIKDLNNLVIFDGKPSQVVRQLFLLDNQIKVLNPCLFKFTKLNVLSLRRNQIRHLPNSIGRLRNLTDLNVSINKLNYLPPQILDLPHLTTFHAGPNPFLSVSDDAVEVFPQTRTSNKTMKWVSPIRLLQAERNTPSLKSLCLDAVSKYDVTYSETKRWKKTIPKHLQPLVAAAISKGKFLDYCEKCSMIAVEPYAEVFEWWDILQNIDVPIMRKFCSGLCLRKYQKENKYAVLEGPK